MPLVRRDTNHGDKSAPNDPSLLLKTPPRQMPAPVKSNSPSPVALSNSGSLLKTSPFSTSRPPLPKRIQITQEEFEHQQQTTTPLTLTSNAPVPPLCLSSPSALSRSVPAPAETPSSPTYMRPIRNIGQDKCTVVAVVAEKIFPKVKFLHKGRQLLYDTKDQSFCQFIIAECNVPTDTDKIAWWDKARMWVSGGLNLMTSDRNVAVKWSFLSMLVVFASGGASWSLNLCLFSIVEQIY